MHVFRHADNDSASLPADGVIWATGFRPDYHWIDVPVFDEQGATVEAGPYEVIGKRDRETRKRLLARHLSGPDKRRVSEEPLVNPVALRQEVRVPERGETDCRCALSRADERYICSGVRPGFHNTYHRRWNPGHGKRRFLHGRLPRQRAAWHSARLASDAHGASQ